VNFIPDREIDLTQNDLLKLYPHVKTLAEIIKNAETPFTIGLFGGWGSGKSSIIKTLKNVLENNGASKIKVFIYDAWKYSKDSFRKTFILELLSFAGLKLMEEVREQFYISESETKQWGFSKIINYQKSTTKIRSTIMYPEQFEAIFDEMIKKIMNKGKGAFKYIKNTPNCCTLNEKLIIVIDNIDRCHKNLMFELLLTIKSFLEKRGVIFVIPIDDSELKKYLEESGYNANEFLRKMFNTSLSIRKFSEGDLYDFAKKLCEKYELKLPDAVISLVVQEFAKSPRKIIQFLNVFQTELELFRNQERNGNIPKGIATENLDVLAKILIIRDEIPKLYKVLRENPSILDEINWQIMKKNPLIMEGESNFGIVNYSERSLKVDDLEIEVTPNQYRFLMRTQNISIKNLEAFIVNRDVFRDLPDEIYNLVLSQDWRSIKHFLEKKKIPFEKLMEFILKIFKQEVIDRRLWNTSGYNLFSLVFKIANDKKFSREFWNMFIKKGAFNDIKSALNNEHFEDLIFEFTPNLLVSFSKILKSYGDDSLIKVIAKTINHIPDKDNNNVLELLKEFVIQFSDEIESLKMIKSKFSGILKIDPSIYEEFEEMLGNNIINLIDEEFLENFINTIQQTPGEENTSEKVNIIRIYHRANKLNDELLEKYVKKALLFSNTADWNTLKFWLENLRGFIESVDEKNTALYNTIFKSLSSRFSFLNTNYIKGQKSKIHILCYKAFLTLAMELYTITNNFDSQIHSWLNTFFNRNESSEVYLYVNELFFEIVDDYKTYDWPFAQSVINKFKNLEDWEQKKKLAKTLTLMLKKTQEDKGLQENQIEDILNSYLDLIEAFSERKEIVINWIKETLVNDVIRNSLKKIMKMMEINDLVKYIEIIKELGDKELTKIAIEGVFSDEECVSLQERLNALETAKIDKKILKSVIEEVLKDLTEDKNPEFYSCFLEFIVENHLLNREINKELVDKLKLWLTSKEPEKNILALKLLSEIEIPPEKKEVIKALINDLDTELFTDENKELFEKVKKKASD